MLLPQLTAAAVAAALLAALFGPGFSQLNPAFTQKPTNISSGNQGVGTTGNTFYFTSNADCNGPVREIYSSAVTISGGTASSTSSGPSTCTITLRSTQTQGSTVYLDILVKSMNIQDCNTLVSVYDGDGATKLMMTYDCRSSQNPNRMGLQTSGSTATFMMTRQNVQNFNFDIEITVTPVSGGINPGSSSELDTRLYFNKFDQMAIVGIIAGFYAAMIGACVLIIICCWRNYWGFNQDWKTRQLETIQTGTSFDAKSLPSNVWSVEMKNGRPGQLNQFSARTATNPRQKQALPEADGDVYYNDDAFQKRRLMNEERARSKYTASNTSFQETEVNSKNYKEKVIAPSTKAGSKSQQPPSYRDAVAESESDQSSKEESENSSEAESEATSSYRVSAKKKPVSSEEEESETPSSSESEEESESDDEDSHRARKRVPHKNIRGGSDDQDGGAGSSSQQFMQPFQQQQQFQYGMYPAGQFVPVMAGPPPHLQRPPMMVPYHTLPQSDQSPPRQQQQLVEPTQPPVYSYLVRRGYTPMEASSQSSSAASQSEAMTKVPQTGLRLDSGVEYMRR